jgi:hypothetical protein
MPVKYRIESSIVVIEMDGEYPVDDVRTTILASLNDPKRPANSSLLIDFSTSLSFGGRSSDEIWTMSHFVASLADRYNNRIAFVAPDDLTYGLVRMGSVISDEKGVSCEIFRCVSEALGWLLS